MYKLYKNSSSSSLHNLSSILNIPTTVKIALELGYKFSFSDYPNLKLMKRNIYEGMRKIAWKVYFEIYESDDTMNETDLLFHKIKKAVCPSTLRCPIERELFGKNFTKKCNRTIKSKCLKESKLHNILRNDLENFLKNNDVIVKPSDKNAGLCIMNYNDYVTEVKRQLNDIHSYRPSTRAEYDIKMFECKDKAHHVSSWLFKCKKIKTIIPAIHKPANFYILPKVHKSFTTFPVGRPISSTLHVINRGVSMLLYKVLQPLCLHIDNLILDSPHLLLLLQNLKLDPQRKYIIITADITSMYLELPINICKKNCIAFFEKYKHVTKFPIEMNAKKLKTLLDLSLDYSFVEFQNEIFYQTKGIQMGNCASVSVANITAGIELQNIWRKEIIFNGRFIDDLLAIADVTEITTNYDVFISEMLQHNFLKFSYEFSTHSVNFLDMTIKLNECNNILTTIFQKPMNKHQFVHYDSNHPKHLLKSLPYSCGLRIIRTCSETHMQQKELENLMKKFQNRGYPLSILENTRKKLETIDRKTLLIPKSDLLIHFLSLHNPTLLNNTVQKPKRKGSSKNVYITIPYTNRIKKLNKLITDLFITDMNKCPNETLKKCIDDINIKIAFSVPNAIGRYLNNK